MTTRDLRDDLCALTGFAMPPRPTLAVHAERSYDGYVERAVSYRGTSGTVPALVLVPDRPGDGGVVVHHQHASQWHFGKSEVAGHVGDSFQAFGPALARRGVTVLAPDAVGFEDRRASATGTEARASDSFDYHASMCYRLLEGRPLMGAVLADAAAAHSVLENLLDRGLVGVAGHSMGGATALFHAAVDTRVDFAAVSGAACTYRHRMAHGTGIEAAQVIPGILDAGDLDDIAALVAPRPMLLCSASADKYSQDAGAIAQAAAGAYAAPGASEGLQHADFEGGHALTAQRFGLIVDWLCRQLAAR